MGALEVLHKLGVDISPPCVLLIYGLPMVGKSCFAACLAAELARSEGGEAVVLATEPSYSENEYVNMLAEYTRGARFHIEAVESASQLFSKIYRLRAAKEYPGRLSCVIVDSISVIADHEMAYLMGAKHITDIRAIAARVSPLLRAITYEARLLSIERKTVVVLIAHPTSTAGTGRFRGVVDWRPSLATRCGHYISYMLFLDMVEDKTKRRLTVVAARNKPWLEGRTIEFTFKKGTVETIEK